MYTKRNVNGIYQTINSGDIFWTAIYTFSSTTGRCISDRKPFKILFNSIGEMELAPGQSGRKINRWYWGYLFHDEQSAQNYYDELKIEQLRLINTRFCSLINSINTTVAKEPGVKSSKEYQEIEQTIINYAKVL